ncbi:hypothetical protein D3C80_1054560 [compost metagenome]
MKIGHQPMQGLDRSCVQRHRKDRIVNPENRRKHRRGITLSNRPGVRQAFLLCNLTAIL